MKKQQEGQVRTIFIVKSPLWHGGDHYTVDELIELTQAEFDALPPETVVQTGEGKAPAGQVVVTAAADMALADARVIRDETTALAAQAKSDREVAEKTLAEAKVIRDETAALADRAKADREAAEKAQAEVKKATAKK